MNCNDIERILDDGDVAALRDEQRAAVAAHLETCRACAREWHVQTQFVAEMADVMPHDLAARCKAVFVAAGRSGGTSSRRARPLVLLGLCLGAAAAALVGSELLEIAGERPDGASAAVTAAPDEGRPDQGEAAAESGPSAASTQAQRASPVTALPDAQAAASPPDSFVLAVSALHSDSLDSAARSIAESIHAELLRQLRALPDITVVETDFEQRGEPIAVIYGARAVSRVASGGTVETVDVVGTAVNGSSGNAYGTRTLTLIDPRGGARSATTGSGSTPSAAADSPSAGAIEVDLFMPSALRARIEAVTGAPASGAAVSAASASGVVNVVVDSSFESATVAGEHTQIEVGSTTTVIDRRRAGETDVRAEVDDAAGAASAGTRAYDYRLDIEATSVAAADSANRWILALHGVGAVSGGSPEFEFTATGDVSQVVDARDTAGRIVESLRRMVLPADAPLLDRIRARVQDFRLSPMERLQALEELREIRQRTGAEVWNDNVTRAVVELVSAARQPAERQRLWQAVRGAKREQLVRPLLDAFLYDADDDVRLEAARTLAGDYIEDTSVRAAFEQAAYTDHSAAIRLEANWAVRDTAARKRYIRDTLVDTRLSDDERVAPLLHALNVEAVALAQEYMDAAAAGREQSVLGISSDYADAIDDGAAEALVGILRRVDDEPRTLTLVLQLARIAHPSLIRFHLETLRDAADERARASAAMALGPRLNEPGVRASLEHALASDPSPRVREAAAQSLSLR